MAKNVSLVGANYPDVPAVDLPQTGGGTARFTDVSDTTASQGDVVSGKYFYDSLGVRQQGTLVVGSVNRKNVSKNGTTGATKNAEICGIQVATATVNFASELPSGATALAVIPGCAFEVGYYGASRGFLEVKANSSTEINLLGSKASTEYTVYATLLYTT
jgi:hypothetical protein